MSGFFFTMTLLVLSLVIVQTIRNLVRKSRPITSFLKKYRSRIILGITAFLVLMPFALLLILGDTPKFAKLTMSFLISLLASIAFGLVVEYVRNLHFRSIVKSREQNEEFVGAQATHMPAPNWETTIELETLKRFGLNSTVGVSFDSLDRLGSQFSEWVMLEREIDNLGTKPT